MDANRNQVFVGIEYKTDSWIVDLDNDHAVSIGTSDDADIRLDDKSLLPIHATLLWNGVSLEVSMTDGAVAFFQGKRSSAQKISLDSGDEIVFGVTRIMAGRSCTQVSRQRPPLSHEAFCDRLNEELARASRGERPTSIAMLKINQSRAPQTKAAMSELLRAGDAVGEYSPSVLALLLADTDRHQASSILQRASASGVEFEAEGVATSPADGESTERLLHRANAALTQSRIGHDAAVPDEKNPLIVAGSQSEIALEALLLLESSTALIVGETGTGRRTLASILHSKRNLPSQKMSILRCAAIPSTASNADILSLIENAIASASDAGTLVLDEIGDLPQYAQALLRDSLDSITPDVHVIATTQRTLAGLVERNAFDSSLYAHFSKSIVELAALRDRATEILPLAERFAKDAGATSALRFSASALVRLRAHTWPGNVAQLRNAIRRAVELANAGQIHSDHLPDTLKATSGGDRLRERVDDVEKDAIVRALNANEHNQTQTARFLGISRRALIYKMEKYGLKRPPVGTS